MRKLICASLIGSAALLFAVPASAQGVEVQVPGVGVRVGDPDRADRERVRERTREEVEIRERRDLNTGECRSRTVQKERSDGSTVTQQDRVCD